MMKMGHYGASSSPAVGMTWVMIGLEVNVLVALACGALVVYCSTWNDLDHPRFKGRMHPGAALVRGTAILGYMIRTAKDKDRADLHRGPSHCVEWCLLVGVAVVVLTWQVPWLSQWAWWWGAACALGCLTHIVADLPTPSGVPLCATWNYFRYGEVWRRHSLNWFTTDSAGEKFLAVPIMFLVTVVMCFAMLGLLDPLFSLLVG